ncbi:MAG: hypothetical protein ACRCV0_07465 [Brevinema sp.]
MSKQSKYQKHFVALIYECVSNKFMSLKDIAKAMGLNYDTLNEWLKVDSVYFKSELSESYLRALKDRECDIVEKTKAQLFKIAWGYEYEETKFDAQGNVIYRIKKQAHPNAKACLEILAKLSPKEWNNDVRIVEVYKSPYDEMTEEELDRELKRLEELDNVEMYENKL